MNDPERIAPLAAFQGEKPPAPAWFERALAREPERFFVEVEGAKVETLAWGRRGEPGLIFLHGGGAHADWWAHIAPYFADRYRVVAPSFTGMGGSDKRDVYRFAQFVREARAAAEAGGAFDRAKPVVVGHSFGARVSIGLAHDFGDAFAAAILVDPSYFAPENYRPPNPPNPPRPAKSRPPYATLGELVARFRVVPPQECLNPFILDHIARRSAREIVDAHGRRGWKLAFDPSFWDHFERVDSVPLLKGARCPLALIRAENSRLFGPVDAAHLLSLISPATPFITLREAEHHVLIDQPLALIAALEALLASWPAARSAP